MGRYLLLIALVGCTRHVPVTDVGAIAGHDDVFVETTANEKIDVVPVVGSGGLRFKTSETDDVDPSQIMHVVEIQRGRGALQGLGIGFLAGAFTGAALGYSRGDDRCPCLLKLYAEQKAALGGFALGGLEGLFGLIVGALIGARDVYDYGTVTF